MRARHPLVPAPPGMQVSAAGRVCGGVWVYGERCTSAVYGRELGAPEVRGRVVAGPASPGPGDKARY